LVKYLPTYFSGVTSGQVGAMIIF